MIVFFYFHLIFFSKALFLEKINWCSLGHKNIGKDAVSYLNPSSYHEKKLLFLICLQKMVFLTRLPEAFKGYIYVFTLQTLSVKSQNLLMASGKSQSMTTYTSDGFLYFTNTPSWYYSYHILILNRVIVKQFVSKISRRTAWTLIFPKKTLHQLSGEYFALFSKKDHCIGI